MKFLVPVDFTEITNPLLRVVKTFAQAHQAEVGLLNVVAPVLYLPHPESFGINTIDLKLFVELQERQKERAKEKLLGLVEFLKPIKVEPLVEVGDAAEVILEKEKDYNLIFIGSHKKGLIERILVGSTTEKVVKYSHKPTFILKGKEPEAIKRVLIAYDFSEHARKAIDFAIKLLKPFSPHFLIVHVEETIEIPLVESIKDNITEKYKEEKLKHLEGLKGLLKDAGFQAEFHIIGDKSPTEGIKGFLKEYPNVDLIVLGNRGLSGLKRVLLGSTCAELIRSLDIPLLVHRGEE